MNGMLLSVVFGGGMFVLLKVLWLWVSAFMPVLDRWS